MNFPNLKICGITSRPAADFCVAQGVGALGVVFYPPSPRHLTPAAACAIWHDLPSPVARVGVFVDMPLAELLAAAATARLTTVQLHGSGSHETIRAVMAAGYRVVKVVRERGSALLQAAAALPPACGLLVECGSGPLPGGNAAAWDWAAAAILNRDSPASAPPHRRWPRYAFALAGGLTPANIVAAITASRATAWDVSSGVEAHPGVKEPARIVQLLAALAEAGLNDGTAPSFWLPDSR